MAAFCSRIHIKTWVRDNKDCHAVGVFVRGKSFDNCHKQREKYLEGSWVFLLPRKINILHHLKRSHSCRLKLEKFISETVTHPKKGKVGSVQDRENSLLFPEKRRLSAPGPTNHKKTVQFQSPQSLCPKVPPHAAFSSTSLPVESSWNYIISFLGHTKHPHTQSLSLNVLQAADGRRHAARGCPGGRKKWGDELICTDNG